MRLLGKGLLSPESRQHSRLCRKALPSFQYIKFYNILSAKYMGWVKASR